MPFEGFNDGRIGPSGLPSWALGETPLDGPGPADAPAPALEIGARGAEVADLQRRLLRAGFDLGAAGADGVFGRATERALATLQRDSALPATGGLDAATSVELDRRLASGFRPVTAEQLAAIMPNAKQADIDAYLGPLNDAMREYGIDTPPRQRAFLAQVAHETYSLKFKEETADGSAYEGRRDLGNTQPGDGARYKGRGLLQVTGRENYRRVGRELGIDAERHPALLAQPENSARAAAYFFQSRGCNELADAGNFREVTRRVNGGYTDLDRREWYHARAKSAIGPS